MTNNHKSNENEEYGEEVLSKSFKAGRRTYFFDVHATRGNDYFVTITESRKKSNPDGSYIFDRHKIFLYKEDFAKFEETLMEVTNFIRAEKREYFEQEERSSQE